MNAALKIVCSSLLATIACTTVDAAAAENGIELTVNADGRAASGIPVVLELANRGKVSAGTTDAQGNVAMPLDLANLGKVPMDVAIEKCPNGERRVVIIAPNGEQKTECKRDKIGVLWWGGSQHATIDLTAESLQVAQTQKAQSSTLGGAAAAIVQGGYVELGLGMANYGKLDDFCNPGAGKCNANDNAFASHFEVGLFCHGFDAAVGYLYNDDVSVGQRSGDATSSSSHDLKVDASGFYVLLGYRIPIMEKFSVIPQVGALRSDAKAQESFTTTFTSGGQTTKETSKLPTETKDGTDVMFGVGVAWQATPRAAVVLNWRHAKLGDQSEGTTDSFLIGGRLSLSSR